MRTDYQVIIDTGWNQKVIKIGKYDLEVKSYPKKKIKQKTERNKVDVKCPNSDP